MGYANYHPVYLDLERRTILIVGGGNVAIEKIESLLATGARIAVVSPQVDPRIAAWQAEGRLEWIQKSFEESDVEPAYMVIAATDDPAVNARVFRAGEDRLRLSNSVDDPANCNFIMAAIARSGPMQVAISSAGCSPALAQRVRNRIATEILTEDLGQLAEFLGNRRAEVKDRLPTYRARQAFWESIIDSEIPEVLRDHGEAAAHGLFEERLTSFTPTNANSNSGGKVYLVGAGPGDPGLITVRATQVLAQADVVLYDRLVNKVLLKYARSSAERVYVGKDLGSPGGPRQKRIHEMLIALASQGKTVVRLKGGDPFVFGRGGEEAQALHEAGISWEVVPGVTSAIAVPAAANIPVSYRKVAPAFGVFAGQEAEGSEGDGIPWAAAALMPTAIFLMGVERLPHIARQLISHGRSADTPVAAISSGTLREQRVVTGTLADIASKAVGLQPPAIIVVGDVVRIGESLTAIAADYAV